MLSTLGDFVVGNGQGVIVEKADTAARAIGMIFDDCFMSPARRHREENILALYDTNTNRRRASSAFAWRRIGRHRRPLKRDDDFDDKFCFKMMLADEADAFKTVKRLTPNNGMHYWRTLPREPQK